MRAFGFEGLRALGTAAPCVAGHDLPQVSARGDEQLLAMIEERAHARRCAEILQDELPAKDEEKYILSFLEAVHGSTNKVFIGQKAHLTPRRLVEDIRAFLRDLLHARSTPPQPKKRPGGKKSQRGRPTAPVAAGGAQAAATEDVLSPLGQWWVQGCSGQPYIGDFKRHPYYFALCLLPIKAGLRRILRESLLAVVEFVLADVERSLAVSPKDKAILRARGHLELVLVVLSDCVVIDDHERVALNVAVTRCKASEARVGTARWVFLGHSTEKSSRIPEELAKHAEVLHDSVLMREVKQRRATRRRRSSPHPVRRPLQRAQGPDADAYRTLVEVVHDLLNVNAPLRTYNPAPLEREELLVRIAAGDAGEQEWDRFDKLSPFLAQRLMRHVVRTEVASATSGATLGASTTPRGATTTSVPQERYTLPARCRSALLRCIHHTAGRAMNLVHGVTAQTRLATPVKKRATLPHTGCALRTGYAMWLNEGARQAVFVPAGDDEGGMEEKEDEGQTPAPECEAEGVDGGELGGGATGTTATPARVKELEVCPGRLRTPLMADDRAGGGKVAEGDCAKKRWVSPNGTDDSGRQHTAGLFSFICPVLGTQHNPPALPRCLRQLGPTLYALPHTGYYIMRSGESINELANFLAAFAVDPRAVLFDRACSLHLNAYGRFPAIFGDCRFEMDSLHKWNHGCAEAAMVRPLQSKLNSSICESQHHALHACDKGVGNMRYATFMHIITVFYCFWNGHQQQRAARSQGVSAASTAPP